MHALAMNSWPCTQTILKKNQDEVDDYDGDDNGDDGNDVNDDSYNNDVYAIFFRGFNSNCLKLLKARFSLKAKNYIKGWSPLCVLWRRNKKIILFPKTQYNITNYGLKRG